MARFEIFQFPVLADNYAVLLHHADTGRTAAIDAADAGTIAGALRERSWTLTDIFVTHHHIDHTAGVAALKERFGATVHGPAADTVAIPALDKPLKGSTRFRFSGAEIAAIDAPGHTRGHIVYHLPEDDLAFVGDVLFSLGC